MFGPDESIWEGGVFSLRCGAVVLGGVAWSLTLPRRALVAKLHQRVASV